MHLQALSFCFIGNYPFPVKQDSLSIHEDFSGTTGKMHVNTRGINAFVSFFYGRLLCLRH